MLDGPHGYLAEAEIAGGVGVRRGAAMRSLRSARGALTAERRLGLGLVDENQKLLLLGSPVEWELAVEL